jgi:hypothetical protein
MLAIVACCPVRANPLVYWNQAAQRICIAKSLQVPLSKMRCATPPQPQRCTPATVATYNARMAIEFVCSSCQSKHACADHLVGRQFKCGGCGRILQVPATSQAGVGAAPRRGTSADAHADHAEERGGMAVWMQVTLLVFGTLVLVVLLLLCLGIWPILLLRTDAPAPDGGPGVEVKEVAPRNVEPPPR